MTAAILLSSGELREYLNSSRVFPTGNPEGPRTEGLGQGFHWPTATRSSCTWPLLFSPCSGRRQEPGPGHCSQTAAVVIGVHWYADQGGVYVLWYLPFVLLMVFRPSLVEVRPPIPSQVEGKFLARVRRLIIRPGKTSPPSRPAGQAA